MSKRKQHKFLKLIILAAGTASTIYCINRFISKVSLIKEKLKIDKGSFYNWKYGNVFYTKKGNGNPLLLIHDCTPYSSSFEWEAIENALSKKYTIYSIDLLGCGRSDKPAIVYSNFLYVQLINDFIKDVIGEKTSSISNGFSSPLVSMACTYNSTLFDKLIFVNPTDIDVLHKIPTKRLKIAKAILDLPLIGTLIYHISTNKENVETLLQEKYFYNPFRVTSNMIETYYESAHHGYGNGKYLLSSIIANYMNTNIIHGLKSIKNDILIIGGKHQPDIEETILKYKAANDSIKYIILDKTKSLPHLEVPKDFLTKVEQFLD